MKRCTGIEFLNQCEYAVLCGNGFGCKYKGECDYQRPKITAHNSKYKQCLELIKQLSDDERENIFAEFCTHCGSSNPQCQCWNDE